MEIRKIDGMASRRFLVVARIWVFEAAAEEIVLGARVAGGQK
jgi:hypothetical protein